MVKINSNYQKLTPSYLFSDIAKRVEVFKVNNPDKSIIRMGIGDVTRPLPESVIVAMKEACDEYKHTDSFHGYGPEQGYEFLRNLIVEHDFKTRGITLSPDEVFVSDGAKCDTANIGDLFDVDNVVAICDPVYPVYLDTNIMVGRAGDYIGGKWSNIVTMPCTIDNGFKPDLPDQNVDIIYLCFPNNPTGATVSKSELKVWVDFALKSKAIILYDAAYEIFIKESDIPKSIYEIEGAKECAIEFRSYSKTVGFTGVRCGYTVVPMELKVDGISLNSMWKRRQTTKFNGASYISQKGAAAIYSAKGKAEVMENIHYYQENAKIIRDNLLNIGVELSGGINAPYIWLKTPNGTTSWEFFDLLLNKAGVVGTPGSGFGAMGEGYFRLTAFSTRELTESAMIRIKESGVF